MSAQEAASSLRDISDKAKDTIVPGPLKQAEQQVEETVTGAVDKAEAALKSAAQKFGGTVPGLGDDKKQGSSSSDGHDANKPTDSKA